MADDSIAICTIANDDFIEGAFAWVHSVKHHAPDYPIKIIDGGLSRENSASLEQIGATIVRPKRAIDFNHPRFGPAYALFDLGYVEADRFVYLDCDMIVVGSLQELLQQAATCEIAVSYANAHLNLTNPEYQLSGSSVVTNNDASVRDELTRHKGLLSRLEKYPSLNTGAVVGSAETMRQIAEEAKKFDAIIPRLRNPDQELLTIVLASMDLWPERINWRNNATYLHGTESSTDGRLRSITNDYMSRFFIEISSGVSVRQQSGELVEKVNVVHFLTKDKPWINNNNMNPRLRRLWRKYRSGLIHGISHVTEGVSQNPKLSIVVVTWNNENFIEQALESCFKSNLLNYEVVVVHNASSDRTREAIDRAIAGFEHMVTRVENDQNLGLGEGRNVGIEHSKGEYILFLDGDDWFEERGLLALQEALDKSPDVVLLNYARVNTAGDRIPNRLSSRMRKGFANSPQERVQLFPILGVAWNKCYRRDFLMENEIWFPDGFYEDIDWNFKTLILANTIFVSPEITTYYRQRSGSILNSADERHFDAIERHEALLEFMLQDKSRIKDFGEAVYRYVRGQIFVVVTKGDRLPRNMEAAYLKRANAILSKYRAAIGQTRISIMERGAKFESGPILRWTNILRGKLRPYSRYFKEPRKKLVWAAKLAVYKYIFMKLPLQKLVVYDSYWGQQTTCNPLAIYHGLLEVGGYSHVWPLTHPASVEGIDKRHVIKHGSLKALKAMATASHLITNVNFPDWYIKRSGQKVLQTHHGTPYKYMGLDIRRTIPNAMNWKKFAQRVSVWDFAVSSNPYSTAVWRRAMPMNYRVIETGYPRNDIFYRADPHQLAGIKSELRVPDGKKVILYAPTFLDWDQTTDHFEIIKLIAESLGPDWSVLYRLHHLSKRGVSADVPRAIDVSSYPQANEVCLISDLLITDFSSIVFDYANMGRPAILLLERVEEYREKRGLYMSPAEASPGLICTSLPELATQLKEREFEGEEARRNAALFRNRFCPWDDGRATERVIEAVFGENARPTGDCLPAIKH